MTYRILSKLFLILGFASGAERAAMTQGSFVNLSFEAAHNIPAPKPIGFTLMSAADALPGWSCFIGANPISSVTYKDLTLDAANIALLPREVIPYPGLIDGTYAIALQSAFGRDITASIAQVGRIPADSKSIRFRGSGPVLVSFAGIPISLFPLSTEGDATEYGGDVTMFAGQTGELRFTSSAHFNYMDAIQFSPLAVPEPSAVTLLAGGLAFLASVRIRRGRLE